MNAKKVMYTLLLIFFIVSLLTIVIYFHKMYIKQESGKINIVVSNFASYDFLRAIVGKSDDVEIDFLVGPGKDSHSFEPSARDIISIEDSDMFVYIGGEIEPWADKVVSSANIDKNKLFCITTYVDLQKEEKIDGAEEHDEEDGAYNYHIWTSPDNAKKMVYALEKEMEKLDIDNKSVYIENCNNYVSQIDEVDKMFRRVLENKKRNVLVFGDKMPMQYFINYYGLDVSAAFNGCSTENDPSSKTVAYLSDLVKNKNIPVILYTELNDGKIAGVIAAEAANGSKPMKIQTLHNISLSDFENGDTWVSLMKRNVDVLKAALQ